MSGHTPGPWVAEIRDGYITGHVTSPNKASDLSGVKRRDSITDPNGMTQHDAYLIASAPDLLEALKGIMDLATAGNWVAGVPMKGDEAISKATAAISRAEGRTPDTGEGG